MFGLDEEQPDRAAVTVQVLENTYRFLEGLPANEKNIRHNHRYLLPLVRTIIPNLEAWECPEVEVVAFPPGRDRVFVPDTNLDKGYIACQTVTCQTYVLNRCIDNPLYQDCYFPITAQSKQMQIIAEEAKCELDVLISNYKQRPLRVVMHSIYFLPYFNAPEYGDHQTGITLALRCALYTPAPINRGAFVNLGTDRYFPYQISTSDVWMEPWF